MTKIINPFEKIREARSIEFCLIIGRRGGEPSKAWNAPADYDEVELIAKREDCNQYDAIRARNNNWSDGQYAIYLGYWNDGII